MTRLLALLAFCDYKKLYILFLLIEMTISYIKTSSAQHRGSQGAPGSQGSQGSQGTGGTGVTGHRGHRGFLCFAGGLTCEMILLGSNNTLIIKPATSAGVSTGSSRVYYIPKSCNTTLS